MFERDTALSLTAMFLQGRKGEQISIPRLFYSKDCIIANGKNPSKKQLAGI
jgi:hypothetical protein